MVFLLNWYLHAAVQLRIIDMAELLIPKFGCIVYVSIPHSIEYMVSSITIADFSEALRSKTS